MASWNCCRTCLSVDCLNVIFSIPEKSATYTDIIENVTGIKIVMNDALPQKMCADCINTINTYVKFRNKCAASQKILLERFENNQIFDIKIEPDQYEHIIDENKMAILNILNTNDEILENHSENHKHNNSPNYGYEDNSEVMEEKTENEVNATNENNHEFVELKSEIGETQETIDLIFGKRKSTRKMRSCNMKKPKKKKMTKKSQQNVENDQPLENTEQFDDKTVTKIKKSTRSNDKIECEYCHKILSSKLSVRNHYKIHTGFDIVCEHCGKRFITRRLLLMHCRAKHGYEKTDKCSFCDYRASNAEQVKIHERLHTGEKPYACRDCGSSFHRKSSYLQHIAIHLPEKNVQCDQCPARFKSVTLMRIHKNRHKQPQYSFKCYVCQSSFARRRNVVRHLQRIHAIVTDLREIERVKLG